MKANLMNEMIDYIEANLTEKINYQRLAKIVGMNEFLMQRVFSIVTGISISEYIRKRRLSKALEEIQNTDQKIIDIAIKYQYSSAISFSRAFKKEYGKSPSDYRKQKEKSSQFLKIHFEQKSNQELEYEITENPAITLWVKKIESDTLENLHYQIRKFYKEAKLTKEYQLWNQIGMYAIYNHKKKEYCYFVGSTKKIPGTEEFLLPAGKYAIFSVGSREQKQIIGTDQMIYHEWLPSTNFRLEKTPCFEYYQQENCFIGVPITFKNSI